MKFQHLKAFGVSLTRNYCQTDLQTLTNVLSCWVTITTNILCVLNSLWIMLTYYIVTIQIINKQVLNLLENILSLCTCNI